MKRAWIHLSTTLVCTVVALITLSTIGKYLLKQWATATPNGLLEMQASESHVLLIVCSLATAGAIALTMPIFVAAISGMCVLTLHCTGRNTARAMAITQRCAPRIARYVARQCGQHSRVLLLGAAVGVGALAMTLPQAAQATEAPTTSQGSIMQVVASPDFTGTAQIAALAPLKLTESDPGQPAPTNPSPTLSDLSGIDAAWGGTPAPPAAEPAATPAAPAPPTVKPATPSTPATAPMPSTAPTHTPTAQSTSPTAATNPAPVAGSPTLTAEPTAAPSAKSHTSTPTSTQPNNAVSPAHDAPPTATPVAVSPAVPATTSPPKSATQPQTKPEVAPPLHAASQPPVAQAGSPSAQVTAPQPQPATATQPAGPEARSVLVKPGDSLWSIAARALGDGASTHDVAQAWPQWYEANRTVIGANPHLITPGITLKYPTSVAHHGS